MSDKRNRDARVAPSRVSMGLALTLGWALSAPAWALKSDSSQPVDIQAGHLESDANTNVSLLTGGVVITRGTMQVTSDRAEVHQGKNQQVERAVFDGKPATLKQDLDDGGQLDAKALHIDYNLAGNSVVLTGDVVIIQPKGEIRSQRVTYDLTTGKFTGGGGEGGDGRVHLRLPPQPAKPAETNPDAKPEAKPATPAASPGR